MTQYLHYHSDNQTCIEFNVSDGGSLRGVEDLCNYYKGKNSCLLVFGIKN